MTQSTHEEGEALRDIERDALAAEDAAREAHKAACDRAEQRLRG